MLWCDKLVYVWLCVVGVCIIWIVVWNRVVDFVVRIIGLRIGGGKCLNVL